jgi:hypothetical protein
LIFAQIGILGEFVRQLKSEAVGHHYGQWSRYQFPNWNVTFAKLECHTPSPNRTHQTGSSNDKQLACSVSATIKAPIFIAHNDYTLKSAPARIRELSKPRGEGGSYTTDATLIEASEVDDLLSKRFIYMNIWRNIADTPIMDTPLAVCDGASVKKVCPERKVLLLAGRVLNFHLFFFLFSFSNSFLMGREWWWWVEIPPPPIALALETSLLRLSKEHAMERDVRWW